MGDRDLDVHRSVGGHQQPAAGHPIGEVSQHRTNQFRIRVLATEGRLRADGRCAAVRPHLPLVVVVRERTNLGPERPAEHGSATDAQPLVALDQAELERLVGNDPDVEAVYPLAPTQQGMLFHTLYDAGSGVYVEQLVATLRGELDVARFREAWRQVALRHGAFRTTFVWEGVSSPLQIVRRQIELPWRLEDWRGHDR